MKFLFWRADRDKASEKKPYVHGVARSAKLCASAAAAAATLACIYPLSERLARADETQQPVAAENTEPGQNTPPATPPPSESSTESNAGSSAATPPPSDSTTAPTEPPQADQSSATELPQQTAETEQSVFYTNFELQPVYLLRSPYQDPALSAFPDAVAATGQRRDITLDNSWDLGGNVIATEAGIAAFGAVRLLDIVRSDFGVLSFNGQPFDPFIKLYVRPQLSLSYVNLAYHGSVAFIDGMPSWVYTSHFASLGVSIPVRLDLSDESKKLWLRFGAVGGIRLSHPAYDDLAAPLDIGASFQITGYPNSDYDYMVYWRNSFYAAADDPMKTAYYAYYGLRLQETEFGLQVRICGDYTLTPYVELGELKNTYALGGTWTVRLSDEAEMDFRIDVGATQWSDLLASRVDPVLRLGATIVVGGSDVNSTNRSEYSHDQDAAMQEVTADRPGRDSGIYGFGNSGDPDFDGPINEAKNRILDSDSFEDFAYSYSGQDVEDLLLTARFLGGLLRKGYAMDAMDAMMHAGFFDEPVQRIASATNEDIFNWMKQYIEWANVHGTDAPLPDELKNGIAVCAGIHWFIANFLYINGIRTAAASVNTPGAPHVITIAMLDDSTVILDYANQYVTRPDSLDEVLRYYGIQVGAPVLQTQIFLPERNGYVITYVTPEGEFFHEVVGIDSTDVLLNEILGVRRF